MPARGSMPGSMRATPTMRGRQSSVNAQYPPVYPKPPVGNRSAGRTRNAEFTAVTSRPSLQRRHPAFALASQRLAHKLPGWARPRRLRWCCAAAATRCTSEPASGSSELRPAPATGLQRQNARIWMASKWLGVEPMPASNGGYLRSHRRGGRATDCDPISRPACVWSSAWRGVRVGSAADDGVQVIVPARLREAGEAERARAAWRAGLESVTASGGGLSSRESTRRKERSCECSSRERPGRWDGTSCRGWSPRVTR